MTTPSAWTEILMENEADHRETLERESMSTPAYVPIARNEACKVAASVLRSARSYIAPESERALTLLETAFNIIEHCGDGYQGEAETAEYLYHNVAASSQGDIQDSVWAAVHAVRACALIFAACAENA